MPHSVLVIEDQLDIAELIKLHLADIDCLTTTTGNGAAGLAAAARAAFDVAVLDVMLPDSSGLEVCRQLRAFSPNTRIVMLTARASEYDRVEGLESGADDYVTKPFSIRELVARVKAQLRRLYPERLAPARAATLRAGAMTIDPTSRAVWIGDREVELTPLEFDLLHYLASDPGRVSTRAQLLEAVWGYKHSGYENTLNAHINRLRNKIEPDPAKPHYVRTVWGVGYKFVDDARTPPAAGA